MSFTPFCQDLLHLEERLGTVNRGASQGTIERCTYPHKYKKVGRRDPGHCGKSDTVCAEEANPESESEYVHLLSLGCIFQELFRAGLKEKQHDFYT